MTIAGEWVFPLFYRILKWNGMYLKTECTYEECLISLGMAQLDCIASLALQIYVKYKNTIAGQKQIIWLIYNHVPSNSFSFPPYCLPSAQSRLLMPILQNPVPRPYMMFTPCFSLAMNLLFLSFIFPKPYISLRSQQYKKRGVLMHFTECKV